MKRTKPTARPRAVGTFDPSLSVFAGSSALQAAVLDETVAFWQPRAARSLTREDAREIIQNVAGFFTILREWHEAELRAAQKR